MLPCSDRKSWSNGFAVESNVNLLPCIFVRGQAHDLLTRDHKKLNEEHQQLQEMLTQREKLIEVR